MTPGAGKRAGALLGVLLLCLAGVGVRLTYVQGLRAEAYAETARKQHVRRIELPAPRGAIYDRRGGELAISVPARTVYANPRQVTDPDATAKALAPVLHRPVGVLAAQLKGDTGFVYLARRIGVVSGSRITKLNLPGIGVVDEARRLYPAGTLGANVVGFIGTDRTGLAGLEYGYEKLLGGKPGFRVLEQDPRGRRIPQGVFTEVLPVQGSDLMLTLDPDLQLAAERALAEAVEQTHAKGGMVVALDARNGEILAMASAPTFDPNELGSFNVDETRNRTVTDAFEPGSVNKIVTASAALNEGLITATDRMWVPDRIVIADKEFKEKGGARDLDLRGILAKSSNLGTIRIAQKVGHHRLNTYLERFGYGRSTGLGFPGESAGSVPKAGQWATQLPTMAIGQSLSVTILQLTRACATIANDGVDIEPRLVSGWVDPKGRPHAPPASRQRRVVEADVARTLRDLLRSVVSDGTAQRAAVPGFEVAGKTGTAQKPFPGGYRGHVSSFVGMVPASKPDIVIGVTLDDPVPVEAGLVAAPVFAQVAKVAVRILHIAPAPPAPEPRPLSGDGHPVDG